MVAIDTRTGATIPVGGAALLSGPALVIGQARRQDETVRRPTGVRAPDATGRRQAAEAIRQEVEWALTHRDELFQMGQAARVEAAQRTWAAYRRNFFAAYSVSVGA